MAKAWRPITLLSTLGKKTKVGIKELNAAMALKRIRLLTLVIVRQLFHATVAPVINYALII